MKRIALLGPAGAGKSWLGRQLAELLDIPVIHLDRLYWKPGWVATPDAEWQEIQLRELERDSWIADGIQEGRIDARPLAGRSGRDRVHGRLAADVASGA